MMVTITTKTINYSITKNDRTHTVNATITSSPGFNANVLSAYSGILKLAQIILAIILLVVLYLSIARPASYTEQMLFGEMFVFGIACSGLVAVFCLLLAYLINITNWIVLTRVSNIEMVFNPVLAILYFVAGVIELVTSLAHRETSSEEHFIVYRITDSEFWCRIIVVLLAFVLCLLHIGSLVFANRDLKGTAPRANTANVQPAPAE